MMNEAEIEKYLLQALNMSLNLNSETSYTNSFAIKFLADKKMFLFIPRLPCSYVIDNSLYQRIFMIANAALYPRYTLLKQNAAFFVALETDDIHIQRALCFPFLNGKSERIVIENFDYFVEECNKNQVPIMKNLVLDLDKVTSLLISGTSGTGKSMFLLYLLNMISKVDKDTTISIVDPKRSAPARWAKRNKINALVPMRNRSKNDFVSQVNDMLSTALEMIYERQEILFENPRTEFFHHWIVIDEMLVLSTDINKAIKESLFSLISQIACLGRETKIHILASSQRYDYLCYPISARENANVSVVLGSASKSTTQFLFPDLDLEGILVPSGIGHGLIQVNDNRSTNNILPLLTPTFVEEEGIL